MSIITTGINIVATGVNQAISNIERFGQSLQNTQRQAQTWANGYEQASQRVQKSNKALKSALSQDYSAMYNDAINGQARHLESNLRRIRSQYDRTFRELGNKYQSMVMGSVALSMSGIGLQNAGMGMLGFSKTALDQARDFETVMSQIQFYGKRTAEEMEKIKGEIFQMGYDLPVKTSEIANAVLSAQKLGYDNPDQALKMAKEASKIQFMGLGKIDGEESMKYISAITKLVGKDVVGKDLEHVGDLTDKLAMTADVSAASIDSLWKTIQSSRSSFDALNGDIDTFLTLTGVMSDRLTPRNAGMALSSFSGGVQMAEKAGRENRGTRGEYYNQLTGAMGGNYDAFVNDPEKGGILGYIQAVSDKSKELWGEGTERVGNLQSMFGKSAVDLFYAVDSYNESTGRSMLEMQKEIGNADGHAQKLMDTLMNGSYGTEMRLQAVIEQFQILYGTAIRPAFNAILDGLTFVIGKVNEFMQKFPRLTKALGYGVGIAGALLVATGATMLFVGGLLALYASIGSVVVQIARNMNVLNMLAQGYGSAGAMIRGNMLGPVKLLGLSLLKLTGITFFLWLAWKNDFLRMKTTFLQWKKDISSGLSESQSMFEQYANGSSQALGFMFQRNMNEGGLDNWIANTWTKMRMLWDGIKDIWKDGILPVDKHQKLEDAGLIGIVEKVYEIKTAVLDFWRGFQSGMKDGIELLKTLLQPLLTIWDWVSEKILGIFQHFGYFENVNKGIGTQWEQWGQKAGYLVGSVIAIRVALWGWLKAGKAILAPFKLLNGIVKGIWGMFNKIAGIKLGKIASTLGKMIAPQGVRNLVNTGRYAVQRRFSGNARQGAHSRIPNARQTIDPTTGRPTGQVTYQRRWLQRNRQGPTVLPSRDGRSSSTLRSRGIGGRMRDMWLGQQYVPDQRTDRRGRTYNQVTRRGGGVTRTTADGRAGGRQVRTGGIRGGLSRIGGSIRNVLGNQRGAVGGGSAGGASRAGRAVGGAGRAVGGAGRGFSIGNLFKGAGKGIGKVAGGLGKGLLKGLGGVLTKGIPLLFKTALSAFSFIGWALLAWEAISLIWSNWDAIKNGAGIAWDWIKEKAGLVWEWIKSMGGLAWEGIKSLAGMAWDWIKLKASEVWNGVVTFAQGAWTWISGIASMVWQGILGFASSVWSTITGIASAVWQGILGFATSVWSAITGIASAVWQGILGFASGVWSSIGAIASGIWTAITGFASTMWNSMKTFATSAWSAVTGIASGVISTIKGFVNGIFDGLFSSATTAWNNVKSFISNNPITQTIKTITEKVTGGSKKSARTGEWYVPKDNMPYNLHQGEMVLKRNEAQILRSMVGSDSNSIARHLLERDDIGGGGIATLTPPQKRIIRPKVNVADQKPQAPQGNGDTSIQVSFETGAIQVANASPSEMKKGAKLMFEEFKRMVELENMKHYKPARPRTR